MREFVSADTGVRLLLPPYRAGRNGRWALVEQHGPRLLRGYYGTPYPVDSCFVLFKQEHGETRVWMSLAPMELESQALAIRAARAHTVIAGLGMVVALANIARKPEVRRVTVVERDPDILALLGRIAAPAAWEGWEKVTLVLADAKDYTPDRPVDFLYVDIWRLLAAKEAVADTQAIQRRVRAARVAWWGQELDFLAWCGEQGKTPPPTLEDYQAFAAWTGLPLIETENPRYPALAHQAGWSACG